CSVSLLAAAILGVAVPCLAWAVATAGKWLPVSSAKLALLARHRRRPGKRLPNAEHAEPPRLAIAIGLRRNGGMNRRPNPKHKPPALVGRRRPGQARPSRNVALSSPARGACPPASLAG